MNVVELLTELGIPYRQVGEHHHATSKYQAQIDCPHCSAGSGKYRMGVNNTFCACWSCGPHRLSDTLAALTNQPSNELWKLIKGLEQQQTLPALKHSGRLQIPKGVGPLLPAHKEYLRSRGFDPQELVRLWRVQGLGYDGGALKWRIFIPVYQQGEPVSWTTRAIGQNARKRYITAPAASSAVPRNKLLFGQDYARHAVLCVEGPFDVFALGPGAVASLGTAYSAEQVAMLARYPVRGVVFDSDAAGQGRARRLVDQLCAYAGETFNFCLDAKDPATAPKRDIKKIREMVGL